MSRNIRCTQHPQQQTQTCIFCMVNKQTGRREIEFGPLLNKALFSRYSAGQETEDAQHVQDLIDNRKVGWVMQFKEQAIREREDEFLKRFYTVDQHQKKIHQLVDYYRYHRNVPRVHIVKFDNVLDYFHNKYKEIRYRKLKQEYGISSREISHHTPVQYSLVLQTFLRQQSAIKSQEQSTQIVYQDLLKQLTSNAHINESYSLFTLTRRESNLEVLVMDQSSPKKSDSLSRKTSLQQIKTTFSTNLGKSKKQLMKISSGFFNNNRILSSQASPTSLQKTVSCKNFSLNNVYSRNRANIRVGSKQDDSQKDLDVLKLIKSSKGLSQTTHQSHQKIHQSSHHSQTQQNKSPPNYSPPTLIQNKVVTRRAPQASNLNNRNLLRLSPQHLNKLQTIQGDSQHIQRQRIKNIDHLSDQNIVDMFKKWQQQYVTHLKSPYQFDSGKRLPTENGRKLEESKNFSNRVKTEQSSLDRLKQPAPKYTKSLFTLMKKK